MLRAHLVGSQSVDVYCPAIPPLAPYHTVPEGIEAAEVNRPKTAIPMREGKENILLSLYPRPCPSIRQVALMKETPGVLFHSSADP